jgi:hypothetical protein
MPVLVAQAYNLSYFGGQGRKVVNSRFPELHEEFEASLGHLMRLCLNMKNRTKGLGI